MKILVPVKAVPDPVFPIRLKPDGTLDRASLPLIPNPFDDIALEAAITLSETGVAQEVIAVSIGPASWADTLKTALAMGAHRAILVEVEADLEPLLIAKLLQVIVEREQPALVLTGRLAVDNDHQQTGPMLAGLLNWGQATNVSQLAIQDNVAMVNREVDGGVEQALVLLPAVLTVDLRLNQPRSIRLTNILKARGKPIDVVDAHSLGINLSPRQTTLSLREPPQRPPGVRVHSVEELAARLRERGF